MTLGILGLAVLGALAFAVYAWELGNELRARRTLTRAGGRVDRIQFANSHRMQRADISFVDQVGQTRQFKTEWSRHLLAVGESVVVGYSPDGRDQSRALRAIHLFELCVHTTVSGAFTGGVVFILVFFWDLLQKFS